MSSNSDELHKQLEIICTKVMKSELDPGQAADRLEKLLADRENASRIDELREVQEYYVADYIDTTAGKNIYNYIESRITELGGKK